MDKNIIEVYFPNGETYLLYPEKHIIQKYGLGFPHEIEERTLFVTGISGSGKTSFVRHICEYENLEYDGQTFILLKEEPEIYVLSKD